VVREKKGAHRCKKIAAQGDGDAMTRRKTPDGLYYRGHQTEAAHGDLRVTPLDQEKPDDVLGDLRVLKKAVDRARGTPLAVTRAEFQDMAIEALRDTMPNIVSAHRQGGQSEMRRDLVQRLAAPATPSIHPRQVRDTLHFLGERAGGVQLPHAAHTRATPKSLVYETDRLIAPE